MALRIQDYACVRCQKENHSRITWIEETLSLDEIIPNGAENLSPSRTAACPTDIPFEQVSDAIIQIAETSLSPSSPASTQSTEIMDSYHECDDEGYAEIANILDWRMTSGNSRQFLVEFIGETEHSWLDEDCLDGCVSKLQLFCRVANIDQTKIVYKTGCGSSNARQNKNNWATVPEILDLIGIYGHKDSIKPSRFNGLRKRDLLCLMQVGEHCMVVLYLAASKTCFVADGTNLYRKDPTTYQLVNSQLQHALCIKSLVFNGQLEDDHCASSAAGIAIEFQRLYRSDELPEEELKVPKSIMDRLRARLHKEPGPKIRPWQPISRIGWKVSCSKCGKKFRTKNRAALNLHTCPS